MYGMRYVWNEGEERDIVTCAMCASKGMCNDTMCRPDKESRAIALDG